MSHASRLLSVTASLLTLAACATQTMSGNGNDAAVEAALAVDAPTGNDATRMDGAPDAAPDDAAPDADAQVTDAAERDAVIADTSATDAAPDAASVARADAASDAVSDATPDVSTDAPSDAPSDAARDASPDACTATAIADEGCSHTYNAYNASTSVHANSVVTWSCTTTTRTVTGNGLPDHAAGTFPNVNCPNTISAQTVSATMPRTPSSPGSAARIGVVGYALNGVKFDPSTAGTCTVSGGSTSCSLIGNTGAWNIEALGQSSFNFGVDSNNAHVQPDGAYHYHGMPTAYLASMPSAPRLVGYALDGFAVYARYGYATASNACSALTVMRSSYRLKSSPDTGRPSTTTYPMGAFTQDYEYVAGLGDLDECNGRFGATPEHPEGVYHYYVTDTFPFIQRCVKGTVAGGTMGNGDGGTTMMPRACTMPSDCTGACPMGSRGCTCSTSPMGMICVPTCSISADCPAGPMGMTLQCRGGVCAP